MRDHTHHTLFGKEQNMNQSIKLPRLTYSVAEAADVLGVSVSNMYQIIKQEGFPVINLRGRRLISVDGLKQWVEKMACSEQHTA